MRRYSQRDDHSILDPQALRSPVRRAALGSLLLNILSLASPLYMMVIYDRVMTSRSESTLLVLTLATVLLLGLLAMLDLFRSIVFARASATFYAELEQRVFAGCRNWAIAGGAGRRARPLEDLDMVRTFLASATPGSLFDILFVPLFIVTLFMIHPSLGVASLTFIGLIIVLAIVNKRTMSQTTTESVEHFRQGCDYAEAHWRQVEASIAMGYAERGEERAAEANRKAILTQSMAASRTGGATSIIKGLRQGSQIVIVAIAAYLALEGSVSMGAIIAASILFSRALAPIDQLVGAWRLIFQTRGAWQRLQEMLSHVSTRGETMELDAPAGKLAVAELVVAPPGANDPILRGVAFQLLPGQSMGIVGPSGSGKSTLAKALFGIWPAVRGSVRLDGADVSQLDMDRVGAYLGYLPQAVELLPGTVAENIRRLNEDDPGGVLDAAHRAGAHEMILSLPNGYDTVIGRRGFALSGGQTQRIGLARALYGRPRLVVLDEPDADLDQQGELALVNAIDQMREDGVTLIVIAHRSALISDLDNLLIMNAGQVAKFGPMDEFLKPVPGTNVRIVK